MKKTMFFNMCRTLFAGAALFAWGFSTPSAFALSDTALDDTGVHTKVLATGVPDYNGHVNWAYSPTTLLKFQDALPLPCNDKFGADAPAGNTNGNGQCITFGVPDTTTYPGSDYYEIEIVQYRERMHSSFDAVNDAPMDATAGGTLLRGYRQVNIPGTTLGPDGTTPVAVTTTEPETPHQMGPVIAAQYDRPVRIKLINRLPSGDPGKLFIPVDQTVMGAGPGPLHDWDGDPRSPDEVCEQENEKCFTENRSTIHLHGGRSPWISDGTAHQWVTPREEFPADPVKFPDTPGNEDPRDPYYRQGVSIANVPDMWFDMNGTPDANGLYPEIPNCAGQTFCNEPGTNPTNDPGPGASTYYWTNTQSARMMFYHEHAWGITRLGVYAGLVAGYFISDPTEDELVEDGILPGPGRIIPLVLQDKTFVDATTVEDTDPTWIWGSNPGSYYPSWDRTNFVATTGDLWWPHVYVPAQDPFNPDLSGTNPFGRWHYGPWFWPPTDVPYGPEPNTYYHPDNTTTLPQPPEVPGAPHPSWGAEAFLDTPVINGTAYPTLTVEPDTYRFKILNGAHDRFFNLQFYEAVNGYNGTGLDCDNITDVTAQGNTEVKMIAADGSTGIPADPLNVIPDAEDVFAWPSDGREGGVPDPTLRGPAIVQIGTDGGFLPKPVVLPNRPINWETDPTLFVAGLVRQQNQGGGTLMMAPAERADIVVDFSKFAGKELILYNDAPAPWPALDPHYDYYTCDADQTEIGGTVQTKAGYGPNTRTLMKIIVNGTDDGLHYPNATPDSATNLNGVSLADMEAAWGYPRDASPVPGGNYAVFAQGQEPIIVGQDAYDDAYGVNFPNSWPNWGLSRITDSAISFMNPDGAIVNAYPLEPKAIQDEMGETFDDFGRMSANLGLEMARTTAGIQTFILQSFVDPPTEVIAQDQVQIWKITHNGVDTHPVHFHLFEVQLLNRVGWDGFIYLPDPNEIGWKDTIRISPLEDTIVALRPVHVPTPFEIPNSIRPLNPATPLGSEHGFTGIDPFTGQARTTPVVNEVTNMGHEYLWHCHILSHEEQDMMRVIVLNQDSLLFTVNKPAGTLGDGFWQWKRGDWSQISTADPEAIVSSGPFAYADFGADGLWMWNGYDWRQLTAFNPTLLETSESGLYASFPGNGLYNFSNNTWTKLTALEPTAITVSGSKLYGDFANGLYEWNNNSLSWAKLTGLHPFSMVSTESNLFCDFTNGLYQWDGSMWTKITSSHPADMVVNSKGLYTHFTGQGVYNWNLATWKKITALEPIIMVASKTNLYANFNSTSIGTYRWNGGIWNKLTSLQPDNMTTSPSILFANFGGNVQKYEHGTWTPLPNSMTTYGVTAMAAGF